MVMRKIKSAPANLCKMSHRKILKQTVTQDKNYFYGKQINIENKDNLILKEKKKSIKIITDIINEIALDDKSPQSEEYYLINFVIPYIGNNLINKTFLKNLFNCLINYFAKSLVIYIFHLINHHTFIEIEQFLHIDYLLEHIIIK